MNKLVISFGCVATVCLVLCGCGSNGKNSFQSAPPEIKQAWEKAKSADKANNYLAASEAYTALFETKLSPEQTAAAQEARTAMNERMYAAAEKGNAEAIKAIAAAKADAMDRRGQ